MTALFGFFRDPHRAPSRDHGVEPLRFVTLSQALESVTKRDFTYDDAIGGYYRALRVALALAMGVGTSLSIVACLVAELIGG